MPLYNLHFSIKQKTIKKVVYDITLIEFGYIICMFLLLEKIAQTKLIKNGTRKINTKHNNWL